MTPILPLPTETEISPAEQERVIDASVRRLTSKKLFLACQVSDLMERIEKIDHTLDELTTMKLEAQEADQDNRWGQP